MGSNGLRPTHSWEIMLFTRDAIGTTEMQKIFSRAHGQINRYCMCPDYDDAQRNPIDRLRLLFDKLAESGTEGQELIRAALNYLAEPIECRVQDMAMPIPDKATIEEECLDDFPELVEMDNLINHREHPRVVSRQAEKAKGEIDETLVRYVEHWKNNYG